MITTLDISSSVILTKEPSSNKFEFLLFQADGPIQMSMSAYEAMHHTFQQGTVQAEGILKMMWDVFTWREFGLV